MNPCRPSIGGTPAEFEKFIRENSREKTKVVKVDKDVDTKVE